MSSSTQNLAKVNVQDKVVSADSSTVEAQVVQHSTPQLMGWRRNAVLAAAFIGFFLSILDTTIVSVALPTIATRFDDFDRSTWVIDAYLLTYMAFSIIMSRLGDIFGRKAIEAIAFTVFMAFSLACALSKSMTQLIVFRAFQGIGGSAMFSSCMVIGMTLTPPQKMHMMSAATSICMVTAGVLGPILGGSIAGGIHQDTWPWIFWLNLPIAGLALALAWPSDKSRKTFTWAALSSIDLLGSSLLLAASILLVFALQQAGAFVYPWDSAPIITSLVISGVCATCFVLWQKWLAARPWLSTKVVFPVNLIGHRVIGSAILTSAFSGFVYYTAIVNIPQRFQIVSGDSPLIAGVRLLAMLTSSAVGSMCGGIVSKKSNNTSPTLIAGAAVQLVGYGLMTTIGDTTSVPAKQYGFQVLLGMGFGLMVTSVTQMISIKSERQWLAVTQGALSQVRTLGGSIGLAIAVIIFNDEIKSSASLSAALSPAQLTSLLHSPLEASHLQPQQELLVAEAFARAFRQQMLVATYIAAAAFVTSIGTWQRHPPLGARATAALLASERTDEARNSEK